MTSLLKAVDETRAGHESEHVLSYTALRMHSVGTRCRPQSGLPHFQSTDNHTNQPSRLESESSLNGSAGS